MIKLTKKDLLLSSLVTIVLGIWFLIFKGGVVSIAMTVFGVLLIVLGILDLVDKKVVPAVVKIVLGVVVIVFGWALVSAVLYILGALLLILGILMLIDLSNEKLKGKSVFEVLMKILIPALLIVTALCLFFNQGGTLDWVFIVSGVVLIVEGIVMLIDASQMK